MVPDANGRGIQKATSPGVVLALLYLTYLISFADRVIFGLLLTPIKETYGFSDSQLGLLSGAAFAVAYGLFSPLTGWATDRFNRRYVMSIAIAFWSAMTMATGFVGSFLTMAIARAGVGIGESAVSPLAVSLIGDSYPRTKRANAFAIYLSAGAAGSLIALVGGGALVAWLSQIGGLELPLLGVLETWRGVFFVAGVFGFAVALLVFVVFRPPARGVQLAITGHGTETTGHFVKNYKFLTFSMFVGLSLITLAAYAWVSWNIVFFERVHGWPRDKIALVFGSASGIMMVLGTVSGGKIVGYLRSRGVRSAPMIFGVGAGIFFATFATAAVLQENVTAAIVFASIAAFSSYMPTIAVYAAMGDVLPAEARGRFSGIQTMTIGILTNSLGPLMIGLLNDSVFVGQEGIRYSLVTTFLGTVALGSALVLLGLPHYRRRMAEVHAVEEAAEAA